MSKLKVKREATKREFFDSFLAIKPHNDPGFIARYVGGVGHEDRAPDEQSHLRFLGLKTPQMDELYKKGWSFSRLPDEDQVAIWTHLYFSSDFFEGRALSLAWWCEPKHFELALRNAKTLLSFVDGVDNWAISDSLSSILARILEAKPALVLPTLKRWNRSANPWERRQSVVALLYYASQRKRFPPCALVLKHVEQLLTDPHIYVQKGVGWTLREVYNVWPKDQVPFVERHLGEISGTAWFATSEKYPKALKARFVAERRTFRKSRTVLKTKTGSAAKK